MQLRSPRPPSACGAGAPVVPSPAAVRRASAAAVRRTAELEQLKRALLGAALTQHGVDLRALLHRYDSGGSGALRLAGLGAHLQQVLPGVLSHVQMRTLLAGLGGAGAAAADGGGGGGRGGDVVTVDDFAMFVDSRHRASAVAVPRLSMYG